MALEQVQSMAPRKSSYRAPGAVTEMPTAPRYGRLLGTDILKFPGSLYLAGDQTLLDEPHTRVCIIGSRAASDQGLKRSAKLARQLAEVGIVVVSGLAKGIDHAAHTAAIEAGGRTIAVIGTPLDRAYPVEHAQLQEQIYKKHLLVSQFPDGSRVFPSNFIARNRTMAVISHASVIVEAGNTSGSLSQASETQRRGRKLFIMQNVLENSALTWPQKFLNAGAVPLRDVSQILEVLKECPPIA